MRVYSLLPYQLGVTTFDAMHHVIASGIHIISADSLTWWRHQMKTFSALLALLWGESTGHRWIPLTKASDAEVWCFLWSAPEQKFVQTIKTLVIWDAIAHYDVTVMNHQHICCFSHDHKVLCAWYVSLSNCISFYSLRTRVAYTSVNYAIIGSVNDLSPLRRPNYLKNVG